MLFGGDEAEEEAQTNADLEILCKLDEEERRATADYEEHAPRSPAESPQRRCGVSRPVRLSAFVRQLRHRAGQGWDRRLHAP
jgi:hypothetical protein